MSITTEPIVSTLLAYKISDVISVAYMDINAALDMAMILLYLFTDVIKYR